MGEFQNKLVVVTGASRGMGLQTARAFLAEGARVVLLARHADKLEAAMQAIETGRDNAAAMVCDLESPPSIEKVFAEIEQKHGSIDILVNNAGAYSESTPWDEISCMQWRGALDLNTLAPYHCTVAAVHSMQAAGKTGCVVNVGSSTALQLKTGRTHYTVSKAAEHTLTQVMAMDLAPHGIRVNMVSPGPTETETIKARLADPAMRPAEEARMKRVPLGRYAAMQDIANAVLFLASKEKAGFLTGVILPVDGGYTLGATKGI